MNATRERDDRITKPGSIGPAYAGGVVATARPMTQAPPSEFARDNLMLLYGGGRRAPRPRTTSCTGSAA